MEIFHQIDVVNSFTGRHHAFSTIIINVQPCDAVVKVHFVERRSGVSLEDCCVMIPDVKVAVVGSQNCVVGVATKRGNLCRTDFPAPYHLELLELNDA
jgi:hypothetical protein